MFFSSYLNKFRYVLFFIFSLVVFSLAFSENYFSLFSDKQWFYEHQIDSDDLVYKSMAMTYLGKSPLLSPLERRDRENYIGFEASEEQYQAFLKEFADLTYSDKYDSSFGLQRILTYPLYWFASIINKYPLVTFLTRTGKAVGIAIAILNAICFSGIALWVAREFNIASGVCFASVTCLLSSWVVVFGHSVYWMMWSWYLPMLFALFYLQKKRDVDWILLLGIALLLCLKALMGYEYVSTIALSAAIPLVYYGIIEEKPLKRLAIDIALVGTASILGVALAFYAHALQLSFFENMTVWQGLEHIYLTASKRTVALLGYSGPEVYMSSLGASWLSVLKIYFSSDFSSEHIWTAFLLVLTFCCVRLPSHYKAKQIQKIKSLLCATWLSILAPISWYILAKGHSFIHLHINIVLWWLPVNLLIIIIGSTLASLFVTVENRSDNKFAIVSFQISVPR